MLSKEEIEINHTKDSFCVRIPLVTEQELKRIDDNLDSITNELTKQIIHDKDLAIAQHIIQKQKDKLDQLEQENKTLKHTNKSYKGIINKQNKIIYEMAKNIYERLYNEKKLPIAKNKDYYNCNVESVKQYFEKKVEEE